MEASIIMKQLRESGLTLTADGDRLLVEPKAAITDQHRAMIRQHKPALLALLSGKTDTALVEYPIPGRLSAPIPPSMKQWDYQFGCWLGETPARPPKRGRMGERP